MDDIALERYSRHILLDEIDLTGQQQLLSSCVLVIGCGGLGCAALPYLAASGVGQLIFTDHDRVERHNLQRQTAFTQDDIGTLKALAMQRRLKALNSDIRLVAVAEQITAANLPLYLNEADVVLDCSDNFPTRQLINRLCRTAHKPLISGAAVRFDGQLAVFDFRQPESACYACLFAGEEANDGACATFGVFSPLVGLIGALQAGEALKILLGHAPAPYLRTWNLWDNSQKTFALHQNPHCPVCSRSAE